MRSRLPSTQQLALTHTHRPAIRAAAPGLRAASAQPSAGASSKTIQTRIYCKAVASNTRTELFLVTRDRPGLLVDICRVLSDCSLSILSASINTEGEAANDMFYVSYRGKALEGPMARFLIPFNSSTIRALFPRALLSALRLSGPAPAPARWLRGYFSVGGRSETRCALFSSAG